MQSSLNTLEEKKSSLDCELIKAKQDTSDIVEKLRDVEQMCSQLQQSLRRFFFFCSFPY